VAWRDRQIAVFEESGAHLSTDGLSVDDAELAAAITDNQLALQREWEIDRTLLSPIAGRMGHHYGDAETSLTWSRLSNDLVSRVCQLFPDNFTGVCQLPQSPKGNDISQCVDELERCVTELGFVGCNLNPDPSDGYWQAPPITDEHYYPLYERMVALEVPAMVHTSMSCNPAIHGTGAHYLNGDTSAFMQLCLSDLFKTFPELRLIIPHGGGAVPYHWGRFAGILQDLRRPQLEAVLGHNVFFDTCVYWQPGLQLLIDTVPSTNLLFASEMIGAVKGVDPATRRRYDDTRALLERVEGLDEDALGSIASGNALRVFPRLAATDTRAQRGARSHS
jgi:4-oxalmesaconate hydratase